MQEKAGFVKIRYKTNPQLFAGKMIRIGINGFQIQTLNTLTNHCKMSKLHQKVFTFYTFLRLPEASLQLGLDL